MCFKGLQIFATHMLAQTIITLLNFLQVQITSLVAFRAVDSGFLMHSPDLCIEVQSMAYAF